METLSSTRPWAVWSPSRANHTWAVIQSCQEARGNEDTQSQTAVRQVAQVLLTQQTQEKMLPDGFPEEECLEGLGTKLEGSMQLKGSAVLLPGGRGRGPGTRSSRQEGFHGALPPAW